MMGDSTQGVKWERSLVVHLGTVSYCVFHYLIEEISDESIPMVWDSAKLQIVGGWALVLNESIIPTCWDVVYYTNS